MDQEVDENVELSIADVPLLADNVEAATSDERFWREMFTLHGSVTPQVIRRVLVFGGLAFIVCGINQLTDTDLGSDLTAYEVAGAVLGFLLVFRANAGYDRWYEGRKLMGGIVNDTRNLAITALTHGPNDRAWREGIIRWIASYGHVCRASLRDQSVPPEARRLLGKEWAAELGRAQHMPSFVLLRVGELLRQAAEQKSLDQAGFLQADRERSKLLDHLGACERIKKTPIPWAYSVNIRRAILLYMCAVPFALLKPVGWMTPILTMLIAYPILGMDQLGVALQQPFDRKSLNRLPLSQITTTIERNVLGLLLACRAGGEQTPKPPQQTRG